MDSGLILSTIFLVIYYFGNNTRKKDVYKHFVNKKGRLI